MPSTKTRFTRGLRVVPAVVVLIAAGVTLAPTHAAAAPNITGCDPGTFYNVDKDYGQSFDGLGTLWHDYNSGGTTITFTSSVSASGTAAITFSVGGSVTIGASAGVNIGVVSAGANASAELSLGAAATTTVGFNSSHGVSIPTPPHWYANAQIGIWRVYTYGYYEVLLSNCTVTFGEWISTIVPTKDTIGYQAGATSNNAIPWIRNNGF